MTPVIDIHAHVFRGRDIPLKGYLLSRTYPEWYVRLLAPVLFTVIEAAVRGESHGWFVNLVKQVTFAYTGKNYRHWADILSLGDMGETTRLMFNEFKQDRIDLSVPLMVDFEYGFKHSRKLQPIVEQIDAMYRDTVLPFKGRVHPFAPFDPTRELAYRARLPGPGESDGGPREKYSSLEAAKEAVRNKGFIGIKVYNPLGYRPLGNAIVDSQRRRIFRRNGMPRYEVFSGEQYDEVLSDLYRYCQREEVPITGHCTHDGIEAYPQASFDFASPRYWCAVLERYPRLHVNLAHFGWSRPEEYATAPRQFFYDRPWQAFQRQITGSPGRAADSPDGREGPVHWVREIAEMLTRYPNLYVDVAHHPVTDDQNILKYREAYAAMCRDFPDVIQKRLLFGIDWHVIARVENYTEFKDRYRRVLEEGKIFDKQQMRDFMGWNALRFLGILPPSSKDKRRWSKNWKRLKSFYRKNRVRLPQWFREASLFKGE
jgi:predicted TIM-barrel fold metal-dependent hydrolase